MSMEEYALYDREEPNLEGFEQTLYDEVSREKPWDLVEKFSKLRRLSPSDDEQAAAEYIVDRFEEYSVPYERYDPEFWLSVPESASISTLGDPGETYSGDERNWKEERPSVKTLAFGGSGTVSGEVVHVELPETESDKDALEAASFDSDVDIEGKIVLVDQMVAAKQFFKSVEEAGAAALVSIHPHPEEPQITTATPIWGAIPDPDQRDWTPEMVNITVSRTVGDRLLELLDDQSTLEVEVTAEHTDGWFECPLVVGKIPGEAAPSNDDFVLLHGHLDSWYYGVTDNATGNAGMVEAARLFNNHREELRRDLWVAFWPAHEGGRYGGSTWFVDEFAHELYDDCVGHVNFDSPGVKDATEFNLTCWMTEAEEICLNAIGDVAGKEARAERPPRAGDYSFYNLGVTGMLALSSGIPEDVREERGFYPVGGSGGNSEAWHHTTDTLDKADPDVLLRDIRVHVVLLSRLLRDEVLPLNYARTVRHHREIVSEYADHASDHFDLTPVLDELDTLESAMNDFYDAIEGGDVDPTTANETMKKISRHLIPVNFAERGRYRQDPATLRSPYPGLAPATELPDLEGKEYRFTRNHLRRSRNEAIHALREARRLLP
jgi:hypothetical protein